MISHIFDENGLAWSHMRGHWAFPLLMTVLMDAYLAGNAALLPIICRSAIVPDICSKALVSLCNMSTMLTSRKECQAALDSQAEFVAWKRQEVQRLEVDLPALQGLFSDVYGMVNKAHMLQ